MRFFLVVYDAAIAGFIIGIAVLGNILIGNPIVGAILFSWGLLTIRELKLPLFTGVIGKFDWNKKECWKSIGEILLGNAIGMAGLVFIASFVAPLAAPEFALTVAANRVFAGEFTVFLSSILCGLIIHAAVKSKSYLPLLFGIPIFILGGFPHCVADLFYYFTTPDFSWRMITIWISSVFGNFIGANIFRFYEMFLPIKKEDLE